MKYRIYLDANQVFIDRGPIEELFNSSILDLKKFIDDNNLDDVQICLPDIVIKERIQQRIENIENEIETANKAIKQLNSFQPELKIITRDENYKSILEKNAEKFINDNKLVKIDLPTIDTKTIVDRAINKMKPFNEKGVGFKDTLIYLSIIDDALKQEDETRYIFCTNDGKEFNDDVKNEFKEKIGKDLYIVRDITKVSELLDELVPLHLHLEQRNKKIKDLIYKNIGELVLTVNKTLSKKQEDDDNYASYWRPRLNNYRLPTYSNALSRSSVLGGSGEEEKEVVAYSFSNINFINISEINDNNYSVSLNLETNIIYHKEDNNDPYSDITSYTYRINTMHLSDFQNQLLATKKNFSLSVQCNLDDETISILFNNYPY